MNCGKNVFDWTEEGARVARPYDCQVGCSTCANFCLGNAIERQTGNQGLVVFLLLDIVQRIFYTICVFT
jgi:MinD superfamily P-loop ATPase